MLFGSLIHESRALFTSRARARQPFLVIEDEKIEIVRLKFARKIPVQFRFQGLRLTRQIDLELNKLHVTGRPPLRSTFPVTNWLCRPSRPAYNFVLTFSKDDLNRLVSSWNLQTNYLISSDQKALQKTSSVRPETLEQDVCVWREKCRYFISKQTMTNQLLGYDLACSTRSCEKSIIVWLSLRCSIFIAGYLAEIFSLARFSHEESSIFITCVWKKYVLAKFTWPCENYMCWLVHFVISGLDQLKKSSNLPAISAISAISAIVRPANELSSVLAPEIKPRPSS